MVSYSSMLWRIRSAGHRPAWRPLRGLLRGLYELGQWLGGGGIAWDARFDGPPCLPHGVRGVFVSRHARVGRNCVMFHDVTIGSNLLAGSRSFGAPEIGDDCYIGAGARVIGSVRVGRGCRIGANCVVSEDVPEESMVVAGRPTVLPRGPMDNRFFTRRHNGWFHFDNGRWVRLEDAAMAAEMDGRLA